MKYKQLLRISFVSLMLIMSSSCSSHTEKAEDAGDYELMDRASTLYDEKKFQEAFDLYTVLQKRHPTVPFYLVQMGYFQAHLGNSEAAISYFQRALDLQPDNIELMGTVASAYMFEHRYQQSSEIYLKILEKEPQNLTALAGLGYIAMQQNHFLEAEKYFTEVLKIDPKHTNALIYLGNLRTRQHRFDDAKQIFTRLQKDDPDNPDVIRAMSEENFLRSADEGHHSGNGEGMAADVSGIPTESEYVEFDSSAHADENVNLLLDLARIYRSQNRALEALEVNLRAYAIDPDRPKVQVELGYGYLGIGQLANADEEFKQVLEGNPQNSDAMVGEAEVAFAMGDTDLAEWRLHEALSIAPDNVSALSLRARMSMAAHNYTAAMKDFQLIAVLDPNNPDNTKNLMNWREKPFIEQAAQAEIEKNNTSAADAYENLIDISPTNAAYAAQLGEIRLQQKKYPEAIQQFRTAVRLSPENNDYWYGLGAAYKGAKQYEEADSAFNTILNRDPFNIEALLGKGVVAQDQKNYELAQYYYGKALGVNPNREDSLGHLAELRLAQKQYGEAEAIFAKLAKKYPEEEWFENGLRRARSQPALDQAEMYSKAKEYNNALYVYASLIQKYPKEVEYYLNLGQVYMLQENYDWAISIFYKALYLEPHNKDVLKAIAAGYLEKAIKSDMVDGDLTWDCCFPYIAYNPKSNAILAQYYLEEALKIDACDGEIYAGLGRVSYIYGCDESAEEYFEIALSLDPKNTTAMSYYGEMLSSQRRFFVAADVLGYQRVLLPDADYALRSFREAYRNTRPSVSLKGFYHEENEWSHLLHEPEAQLQIYGAAVDAIFPINEDVNVAAWFIEEYDVLTDQIDNTTSYAINVQRFGAGFDFDYNPYLFVFGKFGIAYAHQFKSANYPAQDKWLILPALGATYTRWNHRLTGETFSVANIVEQDFDNPRSKLFSGQGIRGVYEYDFGRRRLFGFSAENIWYNDWLHNQYQYGTTWVQWGPEDYYENVVFRYQFSLGRFNDLTTDYYTYQAQTTHTLSINFSKTWYDGDLVVAAGYAHSWQRSFESGQQLTVVPVSLFRFLHREINYGYGQLDYRINPCLDFTFFGDYSKDTFSYEIWNVAAQLNWSF